jgi:hypothetical protein
LGFIEYNGKLEVHNSLLNVVLHDKPEIKTRDHPQCEQEESRRSTTGIDARSRVM